jgi:hypothetical protein
VGPTASLDILDVFPNEQNMCVSFNEIPGMYYKNISVNEEEGKSVQGWTVFVS